MKRKLKIMNHQIDQLKDEISTKESALVKEHLEHQRVDKEKDALKAELKRMVEQAEESRSYIKAQEQEEHKLIRIISEAEAERNRQKKELDQVRQDVGWDVVRSSYLIVVQQSCLVDQGTTLAREFINGRQFINGRNSFFIPRYLVIYLTFYCVPHLLCIDYKTRSWSLY